MQALTLAISSTGLRYLVRHYLGGSMERVLSTGLVPPDTSVPVPTLQDLRASSSYKISRHLAGDVLDIVEFAATMPLVPDASAAAPVTLAPDTGTGHTRILSGPLVACYQLDTGLSAMLTFFDSPGPGALATFAQATITPSLAVIRSSNSALGCDLTAVNLTGAVLSGVDWTQARFDRAILAGVNLSGATLTGASFTWLDLTVVTWGKDVSAAGADFSHTIGTGLALPSTVTGGKRTTFNHAAFTGADWSGCYLTNASLSNAFVTGANFTGANFSGATLTNACLAGLQGGKSNDATMPCADLCYACMPDAILQSAVLNGANLSRAQIYIVNTGASLLNADLTETDFFGADLTGAEFGGLGTTIAGTRFDGAILFQATFNGGTLGLSAAGMPVSMVGTWLENATFSEVRFSGVRMSGARVAVTAGAGVPLFTITSGVAGCVATLGQSQLPAAFTGAGGLFASAGCALSSTATVSVVTAGQCWTLTQSPALVPPGVEDVVYSVVLPGGALEVYASGISLVEQGDGSSNATSYTIAATTLPAASLSADTRCPGYTTKGASDSRGLSWPQMMTAPRPSLAALGQVTRPPRPGRETMPASSREQPPAR
jgi:uncharacterized protein YjbI with pentapeptide repeats